MAYKVLHKHLKKVIKEIHTYNKHSQKLLYKSYSNKYKKELWITFLYFSQIELSKNILHMLLIKNPITIPILVRSSIDILVLMRICNKDITKILSHYKHNVTSKLNDFKNYLKNTDLNKLTRQQLLQAAYYLDTAKITSQDLSHVNDERLQEAAKRKFAQIDQELEQFYRTFSDHVHHGYDSLIIRSGVIVAGKYKPSNKKEIEKNLIYLAVYALLKCIGLTMIELIKCIHLPADHNLEKLMNEINKFQKILDKKLSPSISGNS